MNFLIWLNNLINRLLFFFSLRKRQDWGVVYDSQNKQPLDPAVVKLIKVSTGEIVALCITGLDGRYGFLAGPGKFKILAAKTHYIFPSKLAPEDSDGVYRNLYHGEFLDLRGDSDVLCFNIPMDPVGFDWNQQAKKKYRKFYPRLKNFFILLLAILFWLGFVFSLWHIFARGFSEILKAALFAYGAIFILAVFAPPIRLYGRLFFKQSRKPVLDAVLELNSTHFNGLALSKTQSGQDGKFFLKAEPGKYILKIKLVDKGQERELKTFTIRLGWLGIVNQNIAI